jgi:transcription elongation factor GreA
MKARLIKRFEDEIAAYEHELNHELPKEIQRARELGDLRENAEYHAAKERQTLVQARVSMLRQRVSEIQLMNLERIPHDKAGFGSKITVVENGKECLYELVMPEDAKPEKGLISLASPLGRAFSGKEEGDEVVVATPSGERTFAIVSLITIHEEEESTNSETRG